MSARTLGQWLAWIESCHPSAVALGLGRVAAVRARMGWPEPLGFRVLTVAGTNGKGSAVALLEALLAAAGERVATYTSPHIARYNERVRVAGREAEDADLAAAFARVEAARGDTPLTYFEFATLAAMEVFVAAAPDTVVLEVGLGGRLDAVNAFDADAALVTTIALDHMDWLGDTREAIGREKAGVFRPGRPAVCADPDPPAAVAAVAREVGARLFQAGRDFTLAERPGAWDWHGPGQTLAGLPPPALEGGFQRRNAAGALMLLHALEGPLDPAVVAAGLARARLPGRMERRTLGGWECVHDVAHNPAAAAALAAALGPCPGGRRRALFSMLGDKDLPGVVAALAPAVDRWYPLVLDVPRAAAPEALAAALAGVDSALAPAPPEAAWARLLADLEPGDQVLVCGSFHTLDAVRRLESSPGRPETARHG